MTFMTSPRTPIAIRTSVRAGVVYARWMNDDGTSTPEAPVGGVSKAPGGKWVASTRSGREVARGAWTRQDAITALVRKVYHTDLPVDPKEG